MQHILASVTIECVQGDIASQADCEAVLNAANAQLMPGGGVAGAIHRAAGAGLADECRPLAPIEVGEAVITGAHNLPNQYVIHCLGPVYGRDKPEAELLADCYRNTLQRAEEKGVQSLACCAVSTGIFGYPIEEAADVAFATIFNEIASLKTLTLIRFVLYSEKDLRVHETVLGRLIDEG
jgi:O-acetyl-ADP-ribose deacetylase (regulator of RNase III)